MDMNPGNKCACLSEDEEEINFMQMEKVFLNGLILQEISQYITKPDLESLYQTNTMFNKAVLNRPEFTTTRKLCIYRQSSSYKNATELNATDSNTDLSILQNSPFPYRRIRVEINGNWSDEEWNIIGKLSQNVKHVELVMVGMNLVKFGKLLCWLNSMRQISSLQLDCQLLLLDNNAFKQILKTNAFEKITNIEFISFGIIDEGLRIDDEQNGKKCSENLNQLMQKLRKLNKLKVDTINNELIAKHFTTFLSEIPKFANLQELELNSPELILDDLFATITFPSVQFLSITAPASKVGPNLFTFIQNQESITSFNLQFIDGLIPNPFCPILQSTLSNLPQQKLKKLSLAFQLQTGGREIEENHKNWWTFLSNYTNLDHFEFTQLNFTNEIRRYVFSIPSILSNFQTLQRKPEVKLCTIIKQSKGKITKPKIFKMEMTE